MNQSSIPHLSEREMEIMQLLWEHGQLSAGEIAAHFLKASHQFRNTTYTFLARLLDKGIIRREDPGFLCFPVYDRDSMQLNEARTFLSKVYDGSFRDMFAQFVSKQKLSSHEIDELQKLIDEQKGGK
ncbi:MAG: BlaI/MecI/CopY family transcriptional regulator [Saccharofermentanales bacterium]